MTNEPDFPESDGPQDPSSSVDPIEGSSIDRDDSAGPDDGQPDWVVRGEDYQPGENLGGDIDEPELPDADDLFGPEDDSTTDTIDLDPELGLDEEGYEEAGEESYEEAGEESYEEAGENFQVPPPVAGPVPVARQLTRDPYTSFGGVASGLSHHFGIDVSIIRIAFVALTLFSGIGVVLYLLGWLVIPRAKFWPPVPRAQASAGVSGRELGFLLTGLGLLVLWFSLGGIGAQVVVPLLLIGGGFWFLTQPDRRLMTENGTATVARAASPPMPVAPNQPSTATAPTGSQSSGYAASAPAFAQSAPYNPAQVPPRSRFRRILKPLVIIGLFALPVLAVLGIVGAILAVAVREGEVDFDTAVVEVTTDGVSEVVPDVQVPFTFDEIPDEISGEAGDLVLDLSAIDPDSFDGTPVEVDIDHDFGEVEVIVPEGMNVDVEADVRAGDIQVFDREADGLGVSMSVGQDDPMVELDISVDLGKIVVDTE